jgi:hypothetical protein
MPDRKEERERLRAERLAAERASSGDDRRRLILGYFVAGLLGAAVIAGIVVAVMNSGGGTGDEAEVNEAAGIDPTTGAGSLLAKLTPDEREGTPPPEVEQADLELAAEAADCELELNLEDEGNTHLEPGAKLPDYATNPPASGDHYAENLPDGAYLDYPELGNYLHSLEHGRIQIQYDPELPEDDQLALKGLFDSDPQAMTMFPNPEMPHRIAVVAWTNLMTCDEYSPETIDAIRAFRDTFRGQGPETVAF